MKMRTHTEHHIHLSTLLSLSLSLSPSLCMTPTDSRVNLVPGKSGKNPFNAGLHRTILCRSACLTASDKVKIYSHTKWGAIPLTLAYSVSFSGLCTGLAI